MLKVFYGPNTFAKRVELQKLRTQYITDFGAISIRELSAEDINLSEFEQELLSTGLFSSSELIIIKNAEDNVQVIDLTLRLPESSPKTVVILVKALDKRTTQYKEVSKNKNFIDFPQLAPAKLNAWISASASKLNLKLDSSVVNELVTRTESDQQEIWIYLNQLALLDKEAIQKTDLDLFMPAPASESAFNLLESALKKDTIRLQKTLAELELYREDPYQIVGLLCSQVHSIVALYFGKEAGKAPSVVAADTGIHPYAATQQARVLSSLNLTKSKVSRLVDTVRWLDISLKTINKTEPWPMIDSALTRISVL